MLSEVRVRLGVDPKLRIIQRSITRLTNFLDGWRNRVQVELLAGKGVRGQLGTICCGAPIKNIKIDTAMPSDRQLSQSVDKSKQVSLIGFGPA
jgi:hypothetical protein